VFSKPDKRRFYDQDPILKEMTASLRALEALFLQSMLARHAVGYMYRRPEIRQNLKDVRRIGLKKLMGVKAAQKGTRWYDKELYLQKLFMNLYVLEVPQQRLVAQKVIDALQIVRLYQLHCYAAQVPIQEELLSKLIQDYFEQTNPDSVVLFTHRLFNFLLNKTTDAIEAERESTLSHTHPKWAEAFASRRGVMRPFKKSRRRFHDGDEFSRDLFVAMQEQSLDQQVRMAEKMIEQVASEPHSPVVLKSATVLKHQKKHYGVKKQPKNRWYDQHVMLERFFIQFSICDPDFQRQVSKKALPALELLRHYQRQCELLGEDVRSEAVEAMLDRYFSFEDLEDAVDFAECLKKRFTKKSAESQQLYETILAELTQDKSRQDKTNGYSPNHLTHDPQGETEAETGTENEITSSAMLAAAVQRKRVEDLAAGSKGMKVTETLK
jgi:hypothetical protein